MPLHDPDGLVVPRKAWLSPYPEALRRQTLRRFLGEAQFSLGLLEKAVHAADPAYGAGVAFRIVGCLAHALFALNRQWLMNEKGAVERAATFAVCPESFPSRVEAVFTDRKAAPERLAALVSDTEALVHAC